MNPPHIKAILAKQLVFLSERSANLVTTGDEHCDLCDITAQMIQLAKLLDPELRNQSYVEALQALPSATLTMSDLEEIASARKEKLRRADDALRLLLDECRKKEPAPHLESASTLSAQT